MVLLVEMVQENLHYLKLFRKFYTPESGTVKVDGTLVPFIELGVGFNPELTGRENIYLMVPF